MPKGIFIRGRLVRMLRKQRRMTQATLAKRIGQSVENIKRIERQESAPVGLETSAKLATALGLAPDVLECDGFSSSGVADPAGAYPLRHI